MIKKTKIIQQKFISCNSLHVKIKPVQAGDEDEKSISLDHE